MRWKNDRSRQVVRNSRSNAVLLGSDACDFRLRKEKDERQTD